MAEALDPKVYLGQKVSEIAEQFLTLRKKDLMVLGQHLELEVKPAMKKAQIQEVVLGHMMEEEIIEEGSVDLPKGDSGTALEIRKLEMQHELELRKLDAEVKARQEKLEAEEKARQEKLELEERKEGRGEGRK